MENHPIPQDVTGFKFKLIGSITLKEFFYILGGGILATIVFILPVSFFLKLPLMALFGGAGAALAFLPIDGRPMDKMIMNFLKTIPSENQYLYKKRGENLAVYEVFKPVVSVAQAPVTAETRATTSKKDLFLSRLTTSRYTMDEGEAQFVKSITSLYQENASPVARSAIPADKANQVAPAPLPSSLATTDVKEAARPVVPPKKEIPKNAAPSAKGGAPVKSETPLEAGFPVLPDAPNVILGIVRDPRGKTLQNMLVEVLDSNSNPVRTFKTNSLGQFIAATPLPNGAYTLHVEDPQKQHEFTDIPFEMHGDIFQPLEAKSTDQREKLRQELFGGKNARQMG